MATKKRTANGSNLSDLIRSMLPAATYEEAAEKAKSEGFALSRGYYYVLKSELKKKRAAKRAAPAKRVKVNGTHAHRAVARVSRKRAGVEADGLRLTSTNKAEEAVIRAVEEVGLERIRKVITTIESLFG